MPRTGVSVDGKWLREARLQLQVENYNPGNSSTPLRDDDSGKRQDGAWGVSYRQLQGIETGRRNASDKLLAKIIVAMRITAEDLDSSCGARAPRDSHTARLRELLERVVSRQDDALRRSRMALDCPLPSQAARTTKDEFDLATFIERQFSPSREHSRSSASVRNAKQRGEELLRTYSFDEAIQPCQEAARRNPQDWDARMNLIAAYLFARAGNPLKMWRAALLHVERDPLEPPPEYWSRWQTWVGIVWYRHPHAKEEGKFLLAEDAFLKAMENVQGAAWAIPASHLAVVLFRSGDADKQQEAKGLLDRTLRIWKRDAYPYEWALTQKRLGNYWLLVDPNDAKKRRENLRKAWEHYQAALEEYTQRRFPIEWAQLRYTLADFHLTLAQLDKKNAERHFDDATQTCFQALTRLSIQNGEDWGRAQFNLAESWRLRPNATETQLEDAIQAYQETLRVFPRSFIETEWSETHFPLSQAYLKLAEMRGGDCQLLVRAIASAKAACSVRVPNYHHLPAYKIHLSTLCNLYSSCSCGAKVEFSEIAAAQ